MQELEWFCGGWHYTWGLCCILARVYGVTLVPGAPVLPLFVCWESSLPLLFWKNSFSGLWHVRVQPCTSWGQEGFLLLIQTDIFCINAFLALSEMTLVQYIHGCISCQPVVYTNKNTMWISGAFATLVVCKPILCVLACSTYFMWEVQRH